MHDGETTLLMAQEPEAEAAPRPADQAAPRALRRHVFYVPGFDPLAPRRYRELYRVEAPKQAAWSGYDITVAPGPESAGRQSLQVAVDRSGERGEAVIEFLAWNDLVKAAISKSMPKTIWKMLGVLRVYFGSGIYWPLFRLSRPPMLAGIYPAIMLALQILLGAMLGTAASAALALPAWAAPAAAGGGAVGVMAAFRSRDDIFYVYHLVYFLALAVERRGETPLGIDARLDQFADRVAAAMEGDADEVLIVGHSSGASLAVTLADKVLDRAGSGGGRLALLTLGSVIPMYSFLPEARSLRRALRRLSETEDVAWIDVTAPGDGGCFALTDPVAVSGVDTPASRWPKVISAAFSETLSPEREAATRWRFFTRHLQYVRAFDRPKDYDYFLITAGPQRLGERYRHRGSSPSRVTAPVSPYRSL